MKCRVFVDPLLLSTANHHNDQTKVMYSVLRRRRTVLNCIMVKTRRIVAGYSYRFTRVLALEEIPILSLSYALLTSARQRIIKYGA